MSDKHKKAEYDKPSANRMGRGVQRPELEKVEEEDKGGDKEEFEYLIDKTTGKITWVEEPTFDNQMIKFPGTFKFGPMKYDVFDTGKTDDLKRLNKLLEGTIPMEAPGIQVISHDKTFSEKTGTWMVMLCLQKVFYKVIIQDTVK